MVKFEGEGGHLVSNLNNYSGQFCVNKIVVNRPLVSAVVFD